MLGGVCVICVCIDVGIGVDYNDSMCVDGVDGGVICECVYIIDMYGVTDDAGVGDTSEYDSVTVVVV